MTGSETDIVVMDSIDKSFPGVHALDRVNFRLAHGEIHALEGLDTREGLEDAAHREERLCVRQAVLLQSEPRWLDVSESDARCAAL